MKKWVIVLWVCALMGFATFSHAAEQHIVSSTYLTDGNQMYGLPSILGDAAGNIHVVTVAMSAVADGEGWQREPNIMYYMVGADGEVKISDTWLTTGGGGSTDKNKPDIQWVTPGGDVAVVYHQEKDDVHMMVLDPYAHPMDGSGAMATATTPAAGGSNTGNGTMSEVWTAAGATLTENWTVAYDGAKWTVTGSVTGLLTETLDSADGFFPDVAAQDKAAKVSFRITAGGTPFASGDTFTFSTTASSILVTADEEPISEVDGTQSVAPKAIRFDNGDLLFAWRDGAGEDYNTTLGYRTMSDGSLDEVQYFSNSGDSGYVGYTGTGSPQFAAADGTRFHALLSRLDDSADLYYQLLFSTVDSTDASYVVAPTPVWVFENGRREAMVSLPDGNVMVAFHHGEEGVNDSTLHYVIFDPTPATTGSSLLSNPTPTAGASNVGEGTMENLTVSLAVANANWTVTCVDNSTPGSELWSVVSDAGGFYPDAETDARYFTEQGDISFVIEASGTAFEVGDEFTFTTENSAVVMPMNEISQTGAKISGPSLWVDPNGAGVVLSATFSDVINDPDHRNVFAYLLGYDGQILAGPFRLSNCGPDNNYNYMIWRYIADVTMAGGEIAAVWGQAIFTETTYEGDGAMLGVEDLSASPPDMVLPPQIADVVPSMAYGGDDTTVTITGTNFAEGATAWVGDNELEDVEVTSATEMTGIVAAGTAAGMYDVKVVNPSSLFDMAADALEVVAGMSDAGVDGGTGGDGDDGCGCRATGGKGAQTSLIGVILSLF